MAKKCVTYHIYKKTQGVSYPGECWDGPFTKEKVKRVFEASYCDFDQDGTPSKKQTFRIVMETLEAVTP
jgi:hypothetical protein